MANVTVVPAAIRPVAHDPEDVLDFDAASGYTPALGDLVAGAGANTVNKADATTGDLLNVIWGVVISARRTSQNAGWRVTVLMRGLLEGFTGLTAPGFLYNSATAGSMSDTDPTVTGNVGRVVGVIKNTTQAYICCPALPGQGGES